MVVFMDKRKTQQLSLNRQSFVSPKKLRFDTETHESSRSDCEGASMQALAGSPHRSGIFQSSSQETDSTDVCGQVEKVIGAGSLGKQTYMRMIQKPSGLQQTNSLNFDSRRESSLKTSTPEKGHSVNNGTFNCSNLNTTSVLDKMALTALDTRRYE